ncbi:hypothetical protein D3C73_1337520 [compost metagenome]
MPLTSSSTPLDSTSPSWSTHGAKPTETVLLRFLMWKTEAVKEASMKVGSYLTPASYCWPSSGLSGPDAPMPICGLKKVAALT